MMNTLKRHYPNINIPKLPMRKFQLLLITLLFAAGLIAQPTFPLFPADITVECDAVPSTPKPIATSICPPTNVAFSEHTDVSILCPQAKIIQRIYTATDNCGFVHTQTQTITVVDTKAPKIIFTAPLLVGKKNLDTLILDCYNPPIFDAGSAIAVDVCDPLAKIKFQDNLQVVGDCKKDGFLLLMNCSWIATDACGNKTEILLYFKIVDKTAPLLISVPKDITIECDKVSTILSTFPTVKDLCDGAPTLTTDILNTPSGLCPNEYKITRTWTATDKCGNKASAKQVITVMDKTPPVFSSKPKDVTIQFGQTIPAAPILTATDNCAGKVTISATTTRAIIGCDSLITYKCTAKDECNNTTTLEQQITVIMPKPTEGTLKTDSTGYCLPQGSSVTITLSEIVKPSFSNNYNKIYFLIDKKTGDILKSDTKPSFVLSQTGDYSFHTLIYNSNFDITKIKNISDILKETSCFAFDPIGASVNLQVCTVPDVPACVPPNLNSAVIKNANCAQSDGSITLNVATGLTYTWSNTATTAKIENLSTGLYTVTVALANDAKCFAVKSFAVANIDAPIVAVPNTTAADCDAKNGSATFTDATLTYTWFDGKKINTRNDLAAGFYTVTATKDFCSSIYTFEIFSNNKLTATAAIDKKADCGGNNGAATINVIGVSGGIYTYSWGAGKTKNDLAAGQYSVTVSDAISKCSTIVTFVMPNASTDSAYIILKVDAAKCPSELGKVEAKISVSANFVKPFYTKIVDLQGKSYKEDQLPTGKYNYLVYDAKGCLINSTAFDVKNPDVLVATLDVTEKDCKGNININVIGGTSPYNFDWADLTGTNDPKNRKDLAKGNYTLDITDANACKVAISVTITDKTCTQIPPCKDLIPQKNAILLAKNCADGAKLCLPINLNDYANLTVTDFGKPFTGKITGCDIDTFFNYSYLIFPDTGKTGPYILKNWELDGKNIIGSFDDVKALVDSMNTWNPAGKWTLNTKSYLIEGGSTKHKYGAMTVKQSKGQGEATIQPNISQMIMGTAMNFSPGDHFVVFEDKKTGCKDTLTVKVTCDSCSTIYSGALTLQADSCQGTAKICLDVKSEDLKNTKILNNGVVYAAQFAACANGNVQLSLPVGKNKLNFKDSVTLCQKEFTILVTCKKDTVINPPTFATYITKKICVPDVLDFCFDTTGVTPPATLKDLCSDKTYKAITYKINGLCIKINAIDTGTDTLCLYFCDGKKKCDTTYLILEVCKKPVISKIDTVYKEICVGKTNTVCVGKISVGDISSVKNICEQDATGNASILITPKFNCLDITGKKVGKDKICVQVCGKQGVCDTVVVILDVKKCPDGNALPIAIKDTISTQMDVVALIKPLENDTINGSLTGFGLLSMPQNGEVVVNIDKSISYSPNIGFCNGIDTFRYFIQNQNGKDTALVCITVDCNKFIIFNGFSPNGDNKNTHFHIQGIEQYSDNIVTIFNRWGNMVYEKVSYTNAEGWDGTWNNQLCPDGTYWYKIDLPRLGKTYTGYLYLHR